MGLVNGLAYNLRSADQEVGAKADSREQGDAQHHFPVPAHPFLRFADRQGAYDRHMTSPFAAMRQNYTPFAGCVNDVPVKGATMFR